MLRAHENQITSVLVNHLKYEAILASYYHNYSMIMTKNAILLHAEQIDLGARDGHLKANWYVSVLELILKMEGTFSMRRAEFVRAVDGFFWTCLARMSSRCRKRKAVLRKFEDSSQRLVKAIEQAKCLIMMKEHRNQAQEHKIMLFLLLFVKNLNAVLYSRIRRYILKYERHKRVVDRFVELASGPIDRRSEIVSDITQCIKRRTRAIITHVCGMRIIADDIREQLGSDLRLLRSNLPIVYDKMAGWASRGDWKKYASEQEYFQLLVQLVAEMEELVRIIESCRRTSGLNSDRPVESIRVPAGFKNTVAETDNNILSVFHGVNVEML